MPAHEEMMKTGQQILVQLMKDQAAIFRTLKDKGMPRNDAIPQVTELSFRVVTQSESKKALHYFLRNAVNRDFNLWMLIYPDQERSLYQAFDDSFFDALTNVLPSWRWKAAHNHAPTQAFLCIMKAFVILKPTLTELNKDELAKIFQAYFILDAYMKEFGGFGQPGYVLKEAYDNLTKFVVGNHKLEIYEAIYEDEAITPREQGKLIFKAAVAAVRDSKEFNFALANQASQNLIVNILHEDPKNKQNSTDQWCSLQQVALYMADQKHNSDQSLYKKIEQDIGEPAVRKLFTYGQKN